MTDQTQPFDFAPFADQVAEQNRQFMLLDFTPASIAALDTFINEMWGAEGASPETESWQAPQGKWNTILNFGVYFGETILRRYDGRWVMDEESPGNMLRAKVELPDGISVYPVSRVWKRFKNGVEDGIEQLLRWIRSKKNDEAGPDEWQEWLKQGAWFMRVNRPDHAIPFFERALACPTYDSVRGEIASALNKARDALQAIPAPEPEKEQIPGEPAQYSARPAEEKPDQSLAAIAKARELIAAGQRDAAHSAVKGALELAPDNPELNEILGDILAAMKDINGAMAAFEKGTKRSNSAHAWDGLGLCRQMTGDTDGAIAAWQKAADLDGSRPMPSCRAAAAEEKRGNKLQALKWFQRAMNCNPLDDQIKARITGRINILENDLELLREQADQLAGQGDTAGSVSVYEKIAGINPRDTEAWREAGVGYAMLKQFDKALECLDKALKVDHCDHLAWDYKAVTLARMEKYAMGLSVVDEGLTNCLDSAQLWARRSFLLIRLDRFQEALTSAHKSLELDPDYGSAYIFKFEAERKLGKTTEAIESISRHIAWVQPRDNRKAIESMKLKWEVENPGKSLNVEEAAQLHEYAFQYWQSGDWEKSLQAYQAAIERNPFSFEIWNNFGSSLSGVGRYQEAITCFERAYALNPLVLDFLVNKAVAFARMSRYEEALACHGQILAKYPKSEKSLEGRVRLLGVMKRRDEALLAAEEFAVYYPNRIEAHSLHSQALQGLGRHQEALAAIDRAISINPDNRELWLGKSLILDDLGLEDEACELQVKAFEDKVFAEKYHQDGLKIMDMMGTKSVN